MLGNLKRSPSLTASEKSAGMLKIKEKNFKRGKAKMAWNSKKMSFSYRINPGSISINDGNFLEDALTQVCLPLAAEALPPAVTTVRQAAQQQNSTSSTNTLYTSPQLDTVHSAAQRIDWFTVQLFEQRSHRKQTRLQRFWPFLRKSRVLTHRLMENWILRHFFL